MAVCFFNNSFDNDNKYKCEYEVLSDHIVVTVDYDITEEIEVIDGIKTFGYNTDYTQRDILIVDHDKRINYLLKDAYYQRNSMIYGSPDDGAKTEFVSYTYFRSQSFESLSNLKKTPKVSSITIASKDLIKHISSKSVIETEFEDKLVINLNRKPDEEKRKIGTNNIKEIILREYWFGGFNKDHSIAFDITGHLEIKLFKRVNYTDVPKYVYEILMYLQLYTKNGFKTDEIKVAVNGISYDLFFYMRNSNTQAQSKKYEKSVQSSILDFLENCYLSIPYRNSKTDIRNIPYIILRNDRSIEDNFLMYYRFIECYYKKQNIPDIKKRFIAYSLTNNYLGHNKSLTSEQDNIAREIISLRNHYVHSGYYLRNESLRIKFEDSSKNYTAKTDVNWIYERTRILYECSIDIIFKDMLGYENYLFP